MTEEEHFHGLKRAYEAAPLRVHALDCGCRSAGRSFDLASVAAGDITAALKPYSVEANLELVRRSFAQTEFLEVLGSRAASERSAGPW